MRTNNGSDYGYGDGYGNGRGNGNSHGVGMLRVQVSDEGTGAESSGRPMDMLMSSIGSCTSANTIETVLSSEGSGSGDGDAEWPGAKPRPSCDSLAHAHEHGFGYGYGDGYEHGAPVHAQTSPLRPANSAPAYALVSLALSPNTLPTPSLVLATTPTQTPTHVSYPAPISTSPTTNHLQQTNQQQQQQLQQQLHLQLHQHKSSLLPPPRAKPRVPQHLPVPPSPLMRPYYSTALPPPPAQSLQSQLQPQFQSSNSNNPVPRPRRAAPTHLSSLQQTTQKLPPEDSLREFLQGRPTPTRRPSIAKSTKSSKSIDASAIIRSPTGRSYSFSSLKHQTLYPVSNPNHLSNNKSDNADSKSIRSLKMNKLQHSRSNSHLNYNISNGNNKNSNTSTSTNILRKPKSVGAFVVSKVKSMFSKKSASTESTENISNLQTSLHSSSFIPSDHELEYDELFGPASWNNHAANLRASYCTTNSATTTAATSPNADYPKPLSSDAPKFRKLSTSSSKFTVASVFGGGGGSSSSSTVGGSSSNSSIGGNFLNNYAATSPSREEPDYYNGATGLMSAATTSSATLISPTTISPQNYGTNNYYQYQQQQPVMMSLVPPRSKPASLYRQPSVSSKYQVAINNRDSAAAGGGSGDDCGKSFVSISWSKFQFPNRGGNILMDGEVKSFKWIGGGGGKGSSIKTKKSFIVD
ncbi:hypothetical protein HK100_001842 [Physocladia obscura]|uniref:Uncharacterized protein n=1 Tax=Physocladia obscura TaxID=109957 RepID=A0AAD5XEL5_9FUNG|nr:hypothetical protein HK100_001842 [Physocladia obscura]